MKLKPGRKPLSEIKILRCDAAALADQMQALALGNWQPAGNVSETPAAPFANGWVQLLQLLTADARPGVDVPQRETEVR